MVVEVVAGAMVIIIVIDSGKRQVIVVVLVVEGATNSKVLVQSLTRPVPILALILSY